MLLACEPLYLLYCKDNKVSADNSNELTIFASPSVEPLSQEFKYVFPKEIPHGLLFNGRQVHRIVQVV